MMYVIFNNQGAIKEKQINEWIVQGSNNTNKIGVVIEGTDSTSYAIVGVCKLPNGEVITTTPSVEQAEIKDGVYGVVFSLTEDITALAGTLRINLQAINVNTDKVITSYTVFLCVNEGVDPGEILMMTAQQYQNLLSKIELDVQQDETILTFSALPEAENYSVGQIIYVHNSSVKKLYECVSNNDSLEWHETFDFNNHYTKAETDDLLNEKQDVLTEESLETANLQYAIGFDSQGNLRKGQGGGGGGATYTAGNGIDITDYTISVDDTVVATKTFVSDNYATKSSVESINALIPAQASSSNKLADKDFVNSSIATETATFRGTYNVVTDLGLTTSATEQQIVAKLMLKLASLGITPDKNDYVYIAFPNATVPTQFDKYDNYKCINIVQWAYQYTLNNSSFTAEQWAAINSGITSGLLSQLARESEIADAYSNQATYSVGQYCIYNNTLYRCTIAVSVAEDFDSTKWTACKIADVMVDLDSNQTITGQKTFSNELEIGTTRKGFFGCSPTTGIYFRDDNTSAGLSAGYRSGIGPSLIPLTSTTSLGSENSVFHFIEGYINKITDQNGSYSSDNVFNVINASDIQNNTLTQAQYDLITNGKPTLIKGGPIINSINMLIIEYNNDLSVGFAVAFNTTRGNHELFQMSVNSKTKVISQSTANKRISFSPQSNTLDLYAVALKLNSKTLPTYPTTTTKQYKFVQKVGGNLDYLPDYAQPYATNSTTELKYETINNISVSADTTFTLIAAPTGTYPEYKANITNSGASAITITLPAYAVSGGSTIIKTNDSNITVSNNTFTLPANTTVEVNIVQQNNNYNVIVFNWSAN